AVAVRLTVVDWIWPLKEAVIVAVWLLPMVPLAAVKVALPCPTEMFTVAGTANRMLLLPSETTALVDVALLSATVHVELVLPVRLDGEQDTEESCAGALAAVRMNVWAPPFKLAVSVAV